MSLWSAVGVVVEKITDWVPGRKEHRRNRIEEIKEQMDEISKLPSSAKLTAKYNRLSDILKKLEQQAKNS